MSLPDIELALRSFQQAYSDKEIALQPCSTDQKLFLHVDRPNGELRFTYVRLEGSRVSAMAQAVRCENYEGEPCFNVAWAVPGELRGAGRATGVINAALGELSLGLRGAGLAAFWVEAIVATNNTASQRVAAKAIVPVGIETTDDFAGVPVLQYLRRIDVASAA